MGVAQRTGASYAPFFVFGTILVDPALIHNLLNDPSDLSSDQVRSAVLANIDAMTRLHAVRHPHIDIALAGVLVL